MKIARFVLAVVFMVAALTGCGLFSGTVVVLNNSTYTVVVVNISSVDDSTWGEDWLTGSIAPGASAQFDGVGAGSYDLKAVELGGGFWLTGEYVGEPVSVPACGIYFWTLIDADILP